MQITLTVQLDVDAASWDLNYGTGTNRGKVIANVVSHVEHLLSESIYEGTGSRPAVTVEAVR